MKNCHTINSFLGPIEQQIRVKRDCVFCLIELKTFDVELVSGWPSIHNGLITQTCVRMETQENLFLSLHAFKKFRALTVFYPKLIATFVMLQMVRIMIHAPNIFLSFV